MALHGPPHGRAIALALLLMLWLSPLALAHVGLADVSWTYLYSGDAVLESDGGDMCHGTTGRCMQLRHLWGDGSPPYLRAVNLPLLPNTSCRLFQLEETGAYRVENRWGEVPLYEGGDLSAAKGAFRACTPLPLVLIDVDEPNLLLVAGASSLAVLAAAAFLARRFVRSLRQLLALPRTERTFALHREPLALSLVLLLASPVIVGALKSIVGGYSAALCNVPLILSPVVVVATGLWFRRELRKGARFGTKLWATVFILLNLVALVPCLFDSSPLTDFMMIPLVPYFMMLAGLGFSRGRRWVANRRVPLSEA